jgi:ankyrin repeat protein
MFYDEAITISRCEDEPSVIFTIIKEEYMDLVDKILSRKNFDINVVDSEGNNILMKLLKKGYYDIVIKHLKNKDLDINHQNNQGNTLAHILLSINSIKTVDIYKELRKNKNFNPNIKNNEDETILDISIKNESTFITSKILWDSRFNEVGIVSFKKYYDAYIKNSAYGKYSKLCNLELIVGSLSVRELTPKVKKIVDYFKDNFDVIKEEVIHNKTKCMDVYLDEVIFE